MERVAKDNLCGHLNLSAAELRSFWYLARAGDYLSKPEVLYTWGLVRYERSLNDVVFRWSLADVPDCPMCDIGIEERASKAFYHSPRVCRFWDYVSELTARIAPDEPVLINHAYGRILGWCF